MEYVLYGLKINLVNAFMENIKKKDINTYKHSLRVMNYAVDFGTYYGYSQQDIDILKYSSMLHDIGKLGLPLFVRRKRKGFSKEDERIIKSHVRIGYEMLNTVTCFEDEIDIIYHHHERVDGLGYPEGIKGDKISPLCKIVSVCNQFDIIANEEFKGEEMAIEELIKFKGTKFDENVVEDFIQYICSREQISQQCCSYK